jgi:hypothetical protein
MESMSTAAIEPPGFSRPINNKRKADDADLDPQADASRQRGPFKVVEVAPGGDVLIKVRRPGWNDYVGGRDGNTEGDHSEAGGGEADEAGSGRADEGDIDLEDDDEPDAIDIVVSSEVLCSKSGMFKRMLEGPFIEAQTKTIQVEEEYPTVFVGFCQILHGAFDDSTPIDRDWFVEFLKIVDMRDAIRGVESWVKDRLRKHFQRIDMLAKQPWSQRQFRLKYPFRGIRNGVRHITMTDMMITAAVFRFEDIFLTTSRLCLVSIHMGGEEDAGGIWDNVPACVNGEKLKRKCIFFINLFWSVTNLTRAAA